MEKKVPKSRKLPKELRTWLIPKLRRMSVQWPGRNIAKYNAREEVQVGFFKNGNPEIKIMYRCANSKCNGLFDESETTMDHIVPFIPISGFSDWNDVLPRMFSNPDNWQCLCKSCDYIKTKIENEMRQVYKKKALTKPKK